MTLMLQRLDLVKETLKSYRKVLDLYDRKIGFILHISNPYCL